MLVKWFDKYRDDLTQAERNAAREDNTIERSESLNFDLSKVNIDPMSTSENSVFIQNT